MLLITAPLLAASIAALRVIVLVAGYHAHCRPPGTQALREAREILEPTPDYHDPGPAASRDNKPPVPAGPHLGP